MITFSENKVHYVGKNGGFHMFRSCSTGHDPLLYVVPQARLILRDGSVKIFDRIKPRKTPSDKNLDAVFLDLLDISREEEGDKGSQIEQTSKETTLTR